MFFFLFSSKNEKLVKKWQKEHEKIVELAHKVIGEYTKNNPKKAKKYIRELNTLVANHVMNEDIEFYKMMRNGKKRTNEKTQKMVDEFVKSFRPKKIALISFLGRYSKSEAELNEEFFKTFNELIGVVGERIKFEEENLYAQLKND